MGELIVFLPLLAALVVGLNTTRLSEVAAQVITCSAVVVSAICAWCVFVDVVVHKQPFVTHILPWIQSDGLDVSWSIKVDSITAIMLTLVTTVSSLVHIYSIGYMHHDKHPQRFMAYLSLFTFFMLMLVTADNFVQLFFGWEGVGLASYLLIGFWYKKESAYKAAIKAFVVNRVGDFGLSLGMFVTYSVFGSLQFDEVFANAAAHANETFLFLGHEFHAITLICVLLFIGAMGKSAQLFLHTWLPDAMEGPTPVSALIHAATMVTAGVFLVARCSPLFELAPDARAMVAIVGATTAFFAGTVALTQYDIKRVIAYSTCSQLGFMFFACGVSAYSAGVFHLFTHGFFKALLFLGAGSVIHAMSDEQDMRNMGGLWKKIPITYGMMLIGTLAITGFPYLSGYFSKDAIMEAAFAAAEHGNQAAVYAFWLGLFTAFLTAFYSWRLMFMTFHGKSRASKKVQEHVHESPFVMLFPLSVLAVGTLFVGGAYSHYFHIVSVEALGQFWNNAIVVLGEFNVLEAMHHVPHWLPTAINATGAIGFILALTFYIIFPVLPKIFSIGFKPIYVFFNRKWFFDELYNILFVRSANRIGIWFWNVIDTGIIDRFGPNGFAKCSLFTARGIAKVQSGYVYHYAFAMLVGLVTLLSWFMWILVRG